MAVTDSRPTAAPTCTGTSSPTRRRLLQASGIGLAAAIAPPAALAPLAQEATPNPGDGDGETFPPETQLALIGIVEAALADTMTPGALVGVWYPGQGTWTAAMGISDLVIGAPVSLDDHVRIASITKTFTATVVLQLVEEGLLSLDDTLEQFIPGIPNGAEITIRQLLNMTAGIYSYVLDPLIAEDYVADPLFTFSHEQVADIVREHNAADFAPGAETRYSDTNYVFLGSIIEQVTGRTAAEEITDRIIVPLGLTQTSFPNLTDTTLPEPILRGYLAGTPGEPLRDVTISNPDVAWTAGAMISTLGDLKTWAGALATGTLLSPELQAERLDMQVLRAGPVPVGYGLGILDLAGFLGHNGGILGYSSWMVYEPETGSTVVVVTNRASTEGGTADPIFYGILDLFFPGRFPAPAPEATPSA